MSSEPVRKTISLDGEIYDHAVRQAKQRGFANSFSAYIAWLIRRDAEGAVGRETVGGAAEQPAGQRVRRSEA